VVDQSIRNASNTGKIICVGRNYVEHAKELNNPVPTVPLLFMKPASTIVEMGGELTIPRDLGECHIETEIALLITKPLTNASIDECRSAIGGVGLGFDLTLRDLQSTLKKKGHPWERAKCFDGSCPLSEFVALTGDENLQAIGLTLELNGKRQQQGLASEMLFSIPTLLAEISQCFSLQPGDIVLTGTPAGVCALSQNDRLTATLALEGRTLITASSTVAH